MPPANPPTATNKPAGNAPGADTLAGRMPPFSLEAEMGVLGSMILDRDAIGEIIPILTPDRFYRQDHRLTFEVLLSMYENNKPVDLVLVRDEMKRRGLLDQAGGVDFLVGLVESVPSSANAVYYARIVQEKSMLRNLITAAHEIGLSAYEDRGITRETLEEAERKIFEVTQQKITGQAVPIRQILSQTFELMDKRNGSHIYGLATGFRDLDEITGGLQRGEMIIVAARPSMGKTALGLNIAEYMGADDKRAVAVFSLEMSAQSLVERMLCGRGHIDSQRLRKSMLGDHEVEMMHATAAELSEAPIFVDDTPSLTPLELRAKARRLKMQHNIDAIVIDYLQLMYCPGVESRQQEVATISRHLKAIARELDVPVIVMSQLNRSPEGREGHRPRMSDLRESGSIEQDADVVLMLHREDYYHNEPDYEKTNIAEVIVTKQRNGPTGTIELLWKPEWTRFLDLAHGPNESYGI